MVSHVYYLQMTHNGIFNSCPDKTKRQYKLYCPSWLLESNTLLFFLAGLENTFLWQQWNSPVQPIPQEYTVPTPQLLAVLITAVHGHLVKGIRQTGPPWDLGEVIHSGSCIVFVVVLQHVLHCSRHRYLDKEGIRDAWTLLYRWNPSQILYDFIYTSLSYLMWLFDVVDWKYVFSCVCIHFFVILHETATCRTGQIRSFSLMGCKGRPSCNIHP